MIEYYEEGHEYVPDDLYDKYDINYSNWAYDEKKVPDLDAPHPFPVGIPIITARMERFYAQEWKLPYPQEINQFLVPEGTYADLWKVLDDYMIFFANYKKYNGDLHGDHRWIEDFKPMTLPDGRDALFVHLGS